MPSANVHPKKENANKLTEVAFNNNLPNKRDSIAKKRIGNLRSSILVN